MEHSMFVSLVLVLMLIGLVILIIIVNIIAKIYKELIGIREKVDLLTNQDRQRLKSHFKATVKGQIFYQNSETIKEKTMENYIEPLQEKLEADVSASGDGGGQPSGIPPREPGPKFEAQITGEVFPSGNDNPVG